MMSLSCVISGLTQGSINLAYYTMTRQQVSSLILCEYILLLFSIECHVYLLFLRSTGILRFSPTNQKIMKLAMWIIQVLGINQVIMNGVDRLANTHLSIYVIRTFAGIFGLMVSLLDAFTAFKFSRFIATQNTFPSGADHQSTDIIAKFGLCIALTSLFSSGFIMAEARTGTSISIALSCVSAALWMGMKLALEKAENKREQNAQGMKSKVTLTPTKQVTELNPN
jgi:hypothetical protein